MAKASAFVGGEGVVEMGCYSRGGGWCTPLLCDILRTIPAGLVRRWFCVHRIDRSVARQLLPEQVGNKLYVVFTLREIC